jgi:hypothetical protein
MGSPAITSIRFGRPPVGFGQFRRVPGPIWVTVTVTAPPRDLGDGQWRSLAGSDRLWQAAVFENAFIRSTPPGERRLRGTTETGATGRITGASGAVGRPEPGASPPTGGEIRAAIEQGVRRSGLGLVSVRLTRSPSVAASVVLRVDRPQGFGRRIAAFRQALTVVAPHMDGFETEIVDRCGRPVVLWSAASYTDPRWLCPDPYTLGLSSDCSREPKPNLSC